jgi:hypothetical protein
MGIEMGRLLKQVWPGLQSEQLIGWSIFLIMRPRLFSIQIVITLTTSKDVKLTDKT